MGIRFRNNSGANKISLIFAPLNGLFKPFWYNSLMEVYKYTTAAHYEHIKSVGSLDPRPADGFTYGIPEDPLLWGDHTQEILSHLKKFAGISPIVLLKFLVDENDPDAFVQEGDEYVWFKMDTRKPLAAYKREDYRLPEVVVRKSIPFEDLTQLLIVPTTD